MMVLSCVTTIALIGALFYHRINLLFSNLIVLLWSAAMASLWTPWLLIPLVIILLPLRRVIFSKPALRTFKKVTPPMSRTEKEAIDAGTTWWEGDLFCGRPDWQKLHRHPQLHLTAEEQAFLDGPVNEACRMANNFKITHEMTDLPPGLWVHLKAHVFSP